ncbi:condensin complex protein MksE [Chitinophaga sp.]|uniref:condensin complex protein MksE n=1 Tax=Chitinophaga sp. TaxID=1869181 RepID=UPI00106CABA9
MSTTIKHTAEIFDILSKGKFICSNSVEDSYRKLYNAMDEHFDELYNYFIAIGFVLEKGDEFFYFSRVENRASIESKIEQAYRWVDVVDFFMAFNNGFAPGFRFTPSDVLVQVKIDASLKDKLEIMKRLTGEGSMPDRVNSLIEKQLVAQGYAELENEISQQYKVLASFNYIKQLIVSIQIQEETIHEIPE